MEAIDLFLALAVCGVFLAIGFVMGRARGARELGRDLLAASTDDERRVIGDVAERAARLLNRRTR
jgi:CobQ-like glutamine amidotransferase family enzyme